MSITKQGRELANKLSNEKTGLVSPLLCTELCRLAKSYATIQERWCSEDMSGIPGAEDRLKEREAKLETEIMRIVRQLPGVRGVRFDGDPRGHVVTLQFRSETKSDIGIA